jgi:hypothetical protein
VHEKPSDVNVIFQEEANRLRGLLARLGGTKEEVKAHLEEKKGAAPDIPGDDVNVIFQEEANRLRGLLSTLDQTEKSTNG